MLVALVAYLFTLIVGWISIYVRSPTFGADPGAYISLFLWGAVIEAVRGQTVTISSLKTFVTEQKPVVIPSH